jgi:hypothetical protein
VYPNPVTDHVIICYILQKTETVSILLTDVNGRLVSTFYDGTKPEGKHKETITLPASLTNGTYFIRLTVSGVISTMKIVK